MDYYSAFKRKGILMQTAIVMNPEDTILSGTSPVTQRKNTAWSHLYEIARIFKFIETESQFVVARAWGGRRKCLLLFGGHI
jgi:hypothetical protein